MPPFLCLQCVGEYMQKKISEANGQGVNLTEEELLQNCNKAVTLVPSWQQMQMPSPVGTQMVIACTAVPCCPGHIMAQTPQQTGRSNSGLLVPGGPN